MRPTSGPLPMPAIMQPESTAKCLARCAGGTIIATLIGPRV